jgi:four helix bundle protein
MESGGSPLFSTPSASAMIRSHRELIAWQAGMDLLVESYRVAAHLPATERYGLASQIRRAATSIPANIAEGHGRAARGDFLHFLSIAGGSLRELQTHLEATIRLEYLPQESVAVASNASDRVGFLLYRLRQSLLESPRPPRPPRPP